MDRIEYTFTLHNGSSVTERLSLPDARSRLNYVEVQLRRDGEVMPTDCGHVHRNYQSEARALRDAIRDAIVIRHVIDEKNAPLSGMTLEQFRWLRDHKEPLSQSLGNYVQNFARQFNLDNQTAGKLVIKYITNELSSVFTVRRHEYQVMIRGRVLPTTWNSKGAASAGVEVELRREFDKKEA